MKQWILFMISFSVLLLYAPPLSAAEWDENLPELVDVPGVPEKQDELKVPPKTQRKKRSDPGLIDLPPAPDLAHKKTMRDETPLDLPELDITPELPAPEQTPVAEVDAEMQEIIPFPRAEQLAPMETSDLPLRDAPEQLPPPEVDATEIPNLPPPEPAPLPETDLNTKSETNVNWTQETPTERALPAATPPSPRPTKPPSTLHLPEKPVAQKPATPTAIAALPVATIATLDGATVSQGELYEELKAKYGRKILTEMINRLLLKTEIKRRKITIPQKEIDLAFQTHIDRFMRSMRKKVEAEPFLQYHFGMNSAQYKHIVIWPELALKQLIRTSFAVSDADLFNFYYARRKKYTSPEEVRAWHILVDPTRFTPQAEGATRAAGSREWDMAYRKALDLVNRIRGGADFKQLASTQSDDTAAAKQSGDLGFFPRGSMVKPFEDAAFSLKTGEISDPVKTIYGYHILRVTDHTAERLVPFSDIKEKVRADYETYMVASQAQDLLTKLRKQAYQNGRLKILDPDLMPANGSDGKK